MTNKQTSDLTVTVAAGVEKRLGDCGDDELRAAVVGELDRALRDDDTAALRLLAQTLDEIVTDLEGIGDNDD